MKLHLYVSSGKEREEEIAKAVREGFIHYGDQVVVSPTAEFSGIDPEADVGMAFGVKGKSKAIMDAYVGAGRHGILLDKALVRLPRSSHRYFRVCIDAATPNRYLMREKRPSSRWELLNVQLKPKRKPWGGEIVLALSSQKYCDYHGLGSANAYAERLVRECREWSFFGQQIVYRPKPSWMNYRPIAGTRLSRPPETMGDLLETAHVIVTHGSSAAIDAVVSGVPAIALGESAASFVAGSHIREVVSPPFPSDKKRQQWAFNLAWCQWTLKELASGEAWHFLRREIENLA